MKIWIALLTLLLSHLPASADQRTLEKLVALGVPKRIARLLEFRERHMGSHWVTDVYWCFGKDFNDANACPDDRRIPGFRWVEIVPHKKIVYIDMKQSSISQRMYVIDLEAMKVETLLVTHGKNSGLGMNAVKFSNTPDSRQTSLGIYLIGPAFKSYNHGMALRLYGLERSNDRAYHRDIIIHGASYATAAYLTRYNKKTKSTPAQLGASWGCPAIDDQAAQRLGPELADGALLLIDHEDVMDEALGGQPVTVNMVKNVPLPRPRPANAPGLPAGPDPALPVPTAPLTPPATVDVGPENASEQGL